MAFGASGFDFTSLAVRIGVSEGRKRRAQQKADTRKKRVSASQTIAQAADKRQEARTRVGLIRTQFGATTSRATGQRAKLGEPNVGRRRLSV